MKTLGYYNGKYDSLDKMTVPMADRACSFGDGIYDSAYARNHRVYSLCEHVERTLESCRLLDITPPYSAEQLSDIINDMVSKVDANEQFVYWQVSRGCAARNHAYEEGMKSNLWIIIKECSIRDTYAEIKLISEEDTRFLHCNIKSLNLIPSVMSATRAKRAGCDECVFHRGDRVTECAHSNIHIIKDGTVVTPPADRYILDGIARRHLIAFCREMGIPVDIRPFTVDEMMNADEIFLTSAGSMGLRVREIDGKAVGGMAPCIMKRIQDRMLSDFIEKTSPELG